MNLKTTTSLAVSVFVAAVFLGAALVYVKGDEATTKTPDKTEKKAAYVFQHGWRRYLRSRRTGHQRRRRHPGNRIVGADREDGNVLR